MKKLINAILSIPFVIVMLVVVSVVMFLAAVKDLFILAWRDDKSGG